MLFSSNGDSKDRQNPSLNLLGKINEKSGSSAKSMSQSNNNETIHIEPHELE